MAQDTFRKMVEDGRDIIRILESVPEDKRPLLSALAGAFIDGMLAQDRLAAAERERSGPAHEKSAPLLRSRMEVSYYATQKKKETGCS